MTSVELLKWPNQMPRPNRSGCVLCVHSQLIIKKEKLMARWFGLSYICQRNSFPNKASFWKLVPKQPQFLFVFPEAFQVDQSEKTQVSTHHGAGSNRQLEGENSRWPFWIWVVGVVSEKGTCDFVSPNAPITKWTRKHITGCSVTFGMKHLTDVSVLMPRC